MRLISAASLTIQSYFYLLTAPLCAGYGLGHHETHRDWVCADDPCTARGMFRGPGSAPGTGILQGWSVRDSGVVLGASVVHLAAGSSDALLFISDLDLKFEMFCEMYQDQ